MAGSVRSTTIFRFKTGTGGADVQVRAPGALSGYASSRLFACLRLQPHQIIRCFLRMRRRAEDRPFVVLQNLQPPGNIGGMILPHFRGQVEIGAQEGAAQFRALS